MRIQPDATSGGGGPRESLRRAVESALARACGGDPRWKSASPVGGGCISEALRLETTDGAVRFVKFNSDGPEDLFEREAEGLEALGSVGALRVPRPVAFGEDGGTRFLVTEFIDPAKRRSDFAADLGRGLAALHTASAPRFGFTADNYIGASPQDNEPCGDWAEFFALRRITPQLHMAEARGYATEELASRVGKLLERLPGLIGGHNPAPALVHGDLWGGNCIADEDGRPVLIDPAAHYADREVDLAMSELFGRFDPDFYRAYSEVAPTPEGYETRREVYNLYHLLNHLNLFGLSYMSGVMQILRRFT